MVVLTNGSYVVSSPNWSSGLESSVGAVTLFKLQSSVYLPLLRKGN